jgi:hypothetical protein
VRAIQITTLTGPAAVTLADVPEPGDTHPVESRARRPDRRRGRRRASAPHLQTASPMAQGAALVTNYHTAWFALVLRARLQSGQTVLVQGAAGGVGTATLQIASGLGARTIAVVSSAEKEAVARQGGRRGRAHRR